MSRTHVKAECGVIPLMQQAGRQKRENHPEASGATMQWEYAVWKKHGGRRTSFPHPYHHMAGEKDGTSSPSLVSSPMPPSPVTGSALLCCSGKM